MGPLWFFHSNQKNQQHEKTGGGIYPHEWRIVADVHEKQDDERRLEDSDSKSQRRIQDAQFDECGQNRDHSEAEQAGHDRDIHLYRNYMIGHGSRPIRYS